ncbi:MULTISPECIES: family 16 glycosylhydrolase [unclassified Modestobacter]
MSTLLACQAGTSPGPTAAGSSQGDRPGPNVTSTAPTASTPPAATPASTGGGTESPPGNGAPTTALDTRTTTETYDVFDSPDPTKWTGLTTSPSATVSGGQLLVAATPESPAVESTHAFDLTDGWITWDVDQLPATGSRSAEATVTVSSGDAHQWRFGWADGAALLERTSGGTTTTEYSTYPADTAAWRVRHAAPNLVFEFSADRRTWQEQFVRPDSDIDLASVTMAVAASSRKAEADTGVMAVSQVTVSSRGKKKAASVAPTWSEEFDSLDLASSAHPGGFWRANDTWQPVDAGHAAFDGSRPATWFLNPNQRLAGEFRSPFSVSDGVLSITAQRTPAEWATDIAAVNTQNPGHAPPWSGGLLISNTARPDARFGHGYYEIRMRAPVPAKGGWPALWLFAASGLNPGKENAEIDLLEVFGHASGQPWSVTVHEKAYARGAIAPAAGATTADGQVDVAHVMTDTTDWHTYGLDWQKGHLRFYQDGRQVAEVTGSDAAFFDDVTMSIRLDYAVDASWFPAGQRSDASTPDVLSMQVDHIRRWDTKPVD